MRQAGLLLPYHTPLKESLSEHICRCQKESWVKLSFLNSTFTVTLQDDLQTDLSNLFQEVKYHFLCTNFCLIMSDSEERWMRGLTGPQRAFHSTDSHRQILYVCKSTYLRVRNVVLKDKDTSFVLFWRSTCPVLQIERGQFNAFWQLCQAQEMAAGSVWCCWVYTVQSI